MREIQLYQTNHQTGKTEEYVALSFAEEIARGIDFLDKEVGPEWPSQIDQKVLDLSSGFNCVCGQVFQKHYEEGIDRLEDRFASIAARADQPMAEITYRWGFSVPSNYADADLTNKSLRDSKIAYDWAINYVTDGRKTKYSEASSSQREQAYSALWSLLTEQWISTIKELKGERGIA